MINGKEQEKTRDRIAFFVREAVKIAIYYDFFGYLNFKIYCLRKIAIESLLTNTNFCSTTDKRAF